MADGLLKDEQFLRIQKLNSTDGKRRSIMLDDVSDGGNLQEFSENSSYDAPEHEETVTEITVNADEDGNLPNIKVVPQGDLGKDSIQEKVQSSTAKEDFDVADGDSADDGGESKGKAADNSQLDDGSFTVHLKKLHTKEKLRFRRDSNQKVSFFGDVAFDSRPSILDGSIDQKIRSSFEGPTLEKQIRAAKLMRRNLKVNSEDKIVIEADSLNPNFSGLYVLFWLTVALTCAKVCINYYLEHNGNLWESEILKFMTSDLLTVALVDLVMYLNTYFVLIIHFLCKRKYMKWDNTGFVLVSIYELAFVSFYMYLTENILKLHWVAKIFLFLHSLVLLMKMHSFAFYNGYLWGILDELNFSKNALAKAKDNDNTDPQIIATLERSKGFCAFELESQSKKVPFPENINLKNFFTYSMFPTLVYQIEYPRTERIRWGYVLEKLCAIFGIIFVMMVLAQTYMYPLAIKALEIRDSQWTTLADRLKKWSFILVDYIPSFIAMYLLTFYLIWDAILNCIAELTRFGDRYFYGDWWNCVSWDEFSRIWNVPVHKFLLRHVYHSSMSALKLNKNQATLVTFFLSAVVHELAMYVLFKRLRSYLFFFQMGQLPLVALSNSRFLKKRTIIGNVIFWIGICTGPSVLCTLYLTI
ncbi:hypothetical protein HG535_0A07180 [Zygotorulaspora mrakii]|uniref:O-acyltransferase n=1 Tax=Zygotorulaspora mrakii TaxID=42260 RepID=A0A7H9AWU9_ZYGMR|nr:uncharacterized protein HG535_0A07180 [Zygotorulaspora mrakii]QLG70776.1 hypothetical protein HG535_0A07180 [Zygotorulaspora mrakii]